ncbi:hypothetical protein LZ30DRAFT_362203 [Colletotrichum cereale]|nr:hypothetical protein LZ30DRAFT_362203 [Colletotrichum cereale]
MGIHVDTDGVAADASSVVLDGDGQTHAHACHKLGLGSGLQAWDVDMTTMSNPFHAFFAAQGHGYDVAPATSSHSKIARTHLVAGPMSSPLPKGYWKREELDRMVGGVTEVAKCSDRQGSTLQHPSLPCDLLPNPASTVRSLVRTALRFICLSAAAAASSCGQTGGSPSSPLPNSASYSPLHSIALPLCQPRTQFPIPKGLSLPMTCDLSRSCSSPCQLMTAVSGCGRCGGCFNSAHPCSKRINTMYIDVPYVSGAVERRLGIHLRT